MKGLIRNNFYSVEGSLRMTSAVSLIAIIAMAIGGIYYPNNDNIMAGIIGGMLGAFGALAGTAIQKDNATKWSKFELTMPVSRKDTVTARYISFLLYILIGIFMAAISVIVFYMVTGDVNVERMGYAFAFGTTFAMSIPTFMMPLVLIFGTDKNEILLMVSIMISLGLFFGSSALLSPILDSVSNSNFVFRMGYFILNILLYVLSYFFSVYFYKKKEL